MSKIGIIIGREYSTRVKKKSFIGSDIVCDDDCHTYVDSYVFI